MEELGGKAGPATVVVRSLLGIALWFGALIASLASVYLFREAEPLRDLLLLIGGFAFQGFLAEAIGFQCSSAGVTFPRRFFPKIGFPTLWRRRVPAREISRVDSLGERSVLIYLNSTERVELVLPDYASRHILFRALSAVLDSRRRVPNHSLDKRVTTNHARG